MDANFFLSYAYVHTLNFVFISCLPRSEWHSLLYVKTDHVKEALLCKCRNSGIRPLSTLCVCEECCEQKLSRTSSR